MLSSRPLTRTPLNHPCNEKENVRSKQVGPRVKRKPLLDLTNRPSSEKENIKSKQAGGRVKRKPLKDLTNRPSNESEKKHIRSKQGGAQIQRKPLQNVTNRSIAERRKLAVAPDIEHFHIKKEFMDQPYIIEGIDEDIKKCRRLRTPLSVARRKEGSTQKKCTKAKGSAFELELSADYEDLF